MFIYDFTIMQCQIRIKKCEVEPAYYLYRISQNTWKQLLKLNSNKDSK